MNTFMNDTLTFSDKLQRAGFVEEQADALTLALAGELSEQLATKTDLNELRIATKADINELRITTQRDINELRTATEAEFRSVRSEIRELRTELCAEIKIIHMRIDNLESRFNLVFALLSLLVVLGLIPIVGPLFS